MIKSWAAIVIVVIAFLVIIISVNRYTVINKQDWPIIRFDNWTGEFQFCNHNGCLEAKPNKEIDNNLCKDPESQGPWDAFRKECDGVSK